MSEAVNLLKDVQDARWKLQLEIQSRKGQLYVAQRAARDAAKGRG